MGTVVTQKVVQKIKEFNNKGKNILIVGGAGTGKSRILWELLKDAQEDDIIIDNEQNTGNGEVKGKETKTGRVLINSPRDKDSTTISKALKEERPVTITIQVDARKSMREIREIRVVEHFKGLGVAVPKELEVKLSEDTLVVYCRKDGEHKEKMTYSYMPGEEMPEK